jgi:hypothetical protein
VTKARGERGGRFNVVWLLSSWHYCRLCRRINLLTASDIVEGNWEVTKKRGEQRNNGKKKEIYRNLNFFVAVMECVCESLSLKLFRVKETGPYNSNEVRLLWRPLSPLFLIVNAVGLFTCCLG